MNKKLAFLATTVLAGGMWGAPALADVDVTVTVTKLKDITVQEQITITKNVLVDVNFTATFEGLAEADALVNADTSGHDVLLSLGGDVDGDFNKRVALIDASVSNNLGVILGLNQDSGDNANQGNVVSGALVDVGDDPGTIDTTEGIVAWSQAGVDQKNTQNRVRMIATLPGVPGERPIPPFVPDTEWHVRAEIVGSVNGNNGVIQVNQNAGINPNQHNVLAFAIGLDTGLALGEAALGQENANNTVQDFNTYKQSEIDNSINSNTGIVGVNQNSGHNNNQAAVINIAANAATTQLVPTASQ